MITEKDIGKKVRILKLWAPLNYLVGETGLLLQVDLSSPSLKYKVKREHGNELWVEEVELVEDFKEGDLVEIISHDEPCDYFGKKATYLRARSNTPLSYIVKFPCGNIDAVSDVKLVDKAFKKGDLVKIIGSSEEGLPTEYAFFVEYSNDQDFPYRIDLVTSDVFTPFYEKATKIEKVPPITPEKGKLYKVTWVNTVEKTRCFDKKIEKGRPFYHFKLENSSATFALPPHCVLEEVEEPLKPVTLEGCFNCEVEFYDDNLDSYTPRSIFVGKLGNLFIESDDRLTGQEYKESYSFLDQCSLWKYARRIPGVKYLDD